MLEEQDHHQHEHGQQQVFRGTEVLAALPPPKELTPTEIRDRPMDSTTVPVTTEGKNLRRGLRKKPSTVSNRPPRMEAPMMAP